MMLTHMSAQFSILMQHAVERSLPLCRTYAFSISQAQHTKLSQDLDHASQRLQIQQAAAKRLISASTAGIPTESHTLLQQQKQQQQQPQQPQQQQPQQQQ
jgi:hypothetical protein